MVILGIDLLTIEPHRDAQAIRQSIALLAASETRCAFWIPCVPFIEADGLLRSRRRDTVFNTSLIDESGTDFNRTFGAARCHLVLYRVFVVGSVDVDAVHIDQAFAGVSAEGVNIRLETTFEDSVVPAREPCLAAEGPERYYN